MSMTGKLLSRNGKLYVLYESRNWSEPTITYMWWIVESTKGNPYHAARPEDGDTARYNACLSG